MIGTDLNLTLPSTTETMATNIARIATALQSIEDSIAERVSPAGININAPLDMQGNVLTDVAAVQFASGNIPLTAGSFYYYNGAWYAIDEVGVIQLTENGALKASGFGAITGDYGGSNPAAVTYVDANEQYVFTVDTGVYADIVCDDVILKGTNGTLTIGVDDALTGSRAINVKSLPSAGVSLLAYDASTSTLVDNAVTRTTNTPLFTNVDVSGNIEAASVSVDTDRVLLIPAVAAESLSSQHTLAGSPPSWSYGASNSPVYYPLQLTVGMVIKSVKVYGSRNSGGTLTVDLMKGGVSLGSDSDNTTGPTSFTLEVTAINHTVVEDGSQYTVRITPNGTTGQFTGLVVVTVTGKV